MATKREHEGSDHENESGEETFSMVDVLDEQNELEEHASAVLGASDDKNCTYLQGCIDRQALYACTTCSQSAKKGPVGLCLACSLECHEGHDLVELYTKRNFRCDCGNSKFPDGFHCKLMPKKSSLNEDNKYNHNFQGKYCTCARPYPDPEDKVEDEMIQCSVCEDWYHGRHLGNKAPAEYAEMACDSCMLKLEFLQVYTMPTDEVAVDEDCQYKFLKEKRGSDKKGAGFFSEGWRLTLCTCMECKKLYEEANVLFLPNEGDSVAAYEERGVQNNKSQYEKGMEELSKLDRTQQVEVMHGYHDMKSELKDYLQEFARSGKVVTKDDIAQFFEKMKTKKRRRVEVPLTCR